MSSLRQVLDILTGPELSRKTVEAFRRALENLSGRVLDEFTFMTGTDEMLREAAGILSDSELEFLRQRALQAQQIYLDSVNQERDYVPTSPTGSQMIATQQQRNKDRTDQASKLKTYQAASATYDKEAAKSDQFHNNPAKYIKENR